MTKPATKIHLLRPVQDGSQDHATLFLAGRPGATALPVTMTGDEAEVDVLSVVNVLAQRTGLSPAAMRKLDPLDLFTVMQVVFAPQPARKR